MSAAPLTIGQEVFVPYRNEIAVIEGFEEATISQRMLFGEKLRLRHGKDRFSAFSNHVETVTPELKKCISAWRFLEENSRQITVYLELLRRAGTEGVMNDCGCEKSPLPGVAEFSDVLGNSACNCITLTKLDHRFSTFKDNLLQSRRGYEIEDVRTKSGFHKTILHKEP